MNHYQVNTYVVAVVGLNPDKQPNFCLAMSPAIAAKSKEEAIGIFLPETIKEMASKGYHYVGEGVTCTAVLTDGDHE